MPCIVTLPIWKPIFEWHMATLVCMTGHQTYACYDKDWTMCSKHVKHSKVNS